MIDLSLDSLNVLSIQDLKTYFFTSKGVVKAVDGVSIDIAKGEIAGLVGESGCGKSVTCLSILKLIPNPPAKIVGGKIFLDSIDLVQQSEKQMRKSRGSKVGMIFQDPLSSLNPIIKVGKQLTETILAHDKLSKKEAEQKGIELLSAVGIPDPELRMDQYPFELSGGMRQRIMIALAICTSPILLIADEPTTNLDVTIQAQILELIRTVRDKRGTAVLFITHNLGIVAWLCDRVNVMYAGKIVEKCPTANLFSSPLHPYTRALLNSVPKLGEDGSSELGQISGEVPDLIAPPSGCRFHPRCMHAKEICSKVEPDLIEVKPNHFVSCFMYQEEVWGKT